MSHRFKSIDRQGPEWVSFELKWKERFGKLPTVESIIFLVGVQESNIVTDKYSREDKKDLMHVGMCALLQTEQYFEFEQIDQDGWPHYKKIKNFEEIDLRTQEHILQKCILKYFADFFNLTPIDNF